MSTTYQALVNANHAPPLPRLQQVDLQNQQPQQPQPQPAQPQPAAAAQAQLPVYQLNAAYWAKLYVDEFGKNKGMEACLGNHKQSTKKKDAATIANSIAWARQKTGSNNDSNIKLLWCWFERNAVQRAIAESLKNGTMREDEVTDEHCKIFLDTMGSW